MSGNVTKFTISKGSDNTFTFTIKQNNSTLPLTIVPSDTFSAKLILLSDNSTSYTYTITTPIAGVGNGTSDAANGKITLTIPLADANVLVRDIGSKTDRYYLRPTYKLILDCVTQNNGNFIAKVAEVYVD